MARPPAETLIEQARKLKSATDAKRFYGTWAATYDRDVAGELKFIGGGRIAALLDRYLDRTSSRIIDLGCGTGLVGEALQARGYNNLDGLDLSAQMLKVARRKQVYANCHEADLLQPLDIADATYDAAISAGTFTTGHVDARALPEIVRIIRRNGILACVVADTFWQDGGFASAFAGQQFDLMHHSCEEIAKSGSALGHYLVVRV